jgi:quinoprotein glucose dehydrogenase
MKLEKEVPMIARIAKAHGRLILTAVCVMLTNALHAQEWKAYAGDTSGSHYSKLTEITPANVAKLQVAWSFHTGDVSDGSELPAYSSFETTPLVVNGKMFITTVFSRLIALDPETGKQLGPSIPRSTGT